MRWTLGTLCALTVLAACGNHIFITLERIRASRDTDDHVLVTATVLCESPGYPDCAPGGEYCVEARWIDRGIADAGVPDGGTPDGGTAGLFDVAKACDSRTLVKAEKADLTIRSTRAIPKTPALEIQASVASKVPGPSYAAPIQSP